MYFDEKYNLELEGMIKNIIPNSSRRFPPGLHDNPTLKFVSMGTSNSPGKH